MVLRQPVTKSSASAHCCDGSQRLQKEGFIPGSSAHRSTHSARTTSSGASHAKVVSGPMVISDCAYGRSAGAVTPG